MIDQAPNTERLKKLVLKEFTPQRINGIDNWKELYEICEPNDSSTRNRLRPVLREIGQETACRLIENTTKKNEYYISDGYVYYIKNRYHVRNSISLQLIYRYNKSRSPFEPYIGVYNIPKKYKDKLEEILCPIFDKYNYKMNIANSHIYSSVEYDKDHTKLLNAIDKELLKLFNSN